MTKESPTSRAYRQALTEVPKAWYENITARLSLSLGSVGALYTWEQLAKYEPKIATHLVGGAIWAASALADKMSTYRGFQANDYMKEIMNRSVMYETNLLTKDIASAEEYKKRHKNPTDIVILKEVPAAGMSVFSPELAVGIGAYRTLQALSNWQRARRVVRTVDIYKGSK